ncbi:MAG: Eco57I restriction-modification methylase domain-containing protein, partial [Candidatus Kuenenia stuttgartiensis]|nr:Eco57I restriction-modification methylase domain-containing protein [Candidatus Kuenenia stuttgartiensis]
EEFTPARRWSFLVGANETSHTAQSRLVNMLANDEHNPTLKELEQAFDIETVTEEFFREYRGLFIRTKEELDKIVETGFKPVSTSLKKEFESKGVDTVNFAKKLLGQIVFLYFLQKKGWFGVAREAEWGTGSKHFLRELFEKRHGDYKNFFNDILEPLFYEALRNDRSHDDHYYSQFNCKIPFLNGGLFDPIGNNGGYNWVHNDICLPDSLFSNKNKTKEGDEGNGILDIFDRYNFTVREDEPLEKEVAIDPELLGKAYEKFNAVRPDNFEEYEKALKSGKKGEESKFNKQYGVYYTPREIVHYMCQQSLINYLHTELIASNPDRVPNPVRVKDIETLIHFGEQVSENEEIALIKEQIILEGKQKSSDYKSKLPESIRKNAVLIDQKLADITVCDPAVGSGAFPVGMMSEIVKARNALAPFIVTQASLSACVDAQAGSLSPGTLSGLRLDTPRTTYDFKRQCIEKSLYGVDIDPGAVEIAKLRLWLSLVVDEDDIKTIKPLPNLDYRIMQGNSLIEILNNEFFDVAFNQEKKALIEQLKKAKDELFAISTPSLKDAKRKEIEALIAKIIEHDKKAAIEKINLEIRSKKEQGKLFNDKIIEEVNSKRILELEGKIQKIKDLKIPGPSEHFEWHLNFVEVFLEKGRFDIVIANPPYLRIQEIQKNTPELAGKLKDCYLSASGSFDIYACFVELGIRLMHDSGNIAYILPHKFFQASFGKNLRKLISSQKLLRKIVDFGSSQVFESATTYTCLLFLSSQNKNFKFAELKPNTKLDDLNDVFASINSNNDLRSENVDVAIISNNTVTEKEWHFSASSAGNILSKLKQQPRTLADICEKIFVGLQTSADKIYFLEHISEKDGVINAFSKSLDREISIEKEIVKPLLKGADVHRYSKLQPKIWCIFPYELKNNKVFLYSQKEIKRKFPLAWKYLLENKNELENREHGRFKKNWWCFSRPQNLTEFEKMKILTPDIASNCQMTIDDKGLYHTTTVYSFVFKENGKESSKYFLALLNSKLLWYFLTTTGSVLRGGFFRFKTNYLLPFPIPKELSQSEQKPFIAVVDQILITKKKDPSTDTSAMERQIDQMVYKLYDLTPEEIAIVEG